MEVNRETIEKLARLSRLHFSEEEKMEIQADLQKMIHFVDKLNELDTTGLEPVLHMNHFLQSQKSSENKTGV